MLAFYFYLFFSFGNDFNIVISNLTNYTLNLSPYLNNNNNIFF